MLVKGWIKPSVLLYGSSVLFARKKTRKFQIYIDFHALNTNRKLYVLPLPCVADFLDK